MNSKNLINIDKIKEQSKSERFINILSGAIIIVGGVVIRRYLAGKVTKGVNKMINNS